MLEVPELSTTFVVGISQSRPILSRQLSQNGWRPTSPLASGEFLSELRCTKRSIADGACKARFKGNK